MNETASYTIKRGDSIYNLARAYNTTISAILDANPELNPYNLRLGSTVVIPVNYRHNGEMEGMTPPQPMRQPQENRTYPDNRPMQQQKQVPAPMQKQYDSRLVFDDRPTQQYDVMDFDNWMPDASPVPLKDEYFDNLILDDQPMAMPNMNTKQSLQFQMPPNDEYFDNPIAEPNIYMKQAMPNMESNPSQSALPEMLQQNGIDFDDRSTEQLLQEKLLKTPVSDPAKIEKTLSDADNLYPQKNINPPQRQFTLFSERPDVKMPTGSVHAFSRGMELAVTDISQWSRFLLVSIVSDLDDSNDVAARLMRAPTDIGSIFGMYYPRSVSARIEELYSGFITAEGRLLEAYHNGSQDTPALNTAWSDSANKLAEALSGINPNYSYDVIVGYLTKYIDDSKREWVLRMGGEHADEIAAYNGITMAMLDYAKYLSDGIIKQFPNRFKIAE